MVLIFHDPIALNPTMMANFLCLSPVPSLEEMDPLLLLLLMVNWVRITTGHVSFEVASKVTLKE